MASPQKLQVSVTTATWFMSTEKFVCTCNGYYNSQCLFIFYLFPLLLLTIHLHKGISTEAGRRYVDN